MILCVAEKSSVSEAASRILGGSGVQKTRLAKWHSEYRFRRPFRGVSEEFVFLNVAGHLSDYEFPQGYGWGECDPRSLLEAPLAASWNSTFRAIARKYAQLCSALLLFLDGDREGEYIAWEVVEAFAASAGGRRFDIRPSALPKVGVISQQAVKNIIASDSGDTRAGPDSIVPVLRADFGSLTHEALEEALRTLRPIDTRVVDSIAVRRQLDLRVGFAMTRLQTELLRAADRAAERAMGNSLRAAKPWKREKKSSRGSSVYSYGPCQIPALGLVWLGEGLSGVDRRSVRAMEERVRVQLTSKDGDSFQYVGAENDPRALPGAKGENAGAAGKTGSSRPGKEAGTSPRSSQTIDLDSSSSLTPPSPGSSTQEDELMRQTVGPQPEQLPPGPALAPCLAADLAAQVSSELRDRPFIRVVSLTRERFTQSRPQPLATVDLQQAMASRYTGKATLDAAEALYLQGVISYPRTETKRYEEGRGYFSKLLDTLTRKGTAASDVSLTEGAAELGSLLSVACSLRAGFNLPPATSRKRDKAHPPIHPLKLCTQFSTKPMMDVYCYVLRHFLATLSEDCVKERTEVRATAAGRAYAAKTVQVVAPGYLSVLYGVGAPGGPGAVGSSASSSAGAAKYSEGSLVEIAEVSVVGDGAGGVEGETPTPDLPLDSSPAPPPNSLSPVVPLAPPPTEKSLLGAMDKYNIGTDATMADHIDMIKQRSYVKEEGVQRRQSARRARQVPRATRGAAAPQPSPLKSVRQFSVLDAGRRVIRLFLGASHGPAVVSALGRACTEIGMRCIADGVLEPQRVLGDSLAFARYLYDSTLQGVRRAGAPGAGANTSGTRCYRGATEPNGATPGQRPGKQAHRPPFVGARPLPAPQLTCCGSKCVCTATGGVCRECGLPWTMRRQGPVSVLPETCPTCGLSLCVWRDDAQRRKVCMRCD